MRLTEPQLSLIVDALNGSLIDDPDMLMMEIEDTEPDGLAAKWGVDLRELVATPGNLTSGQRIALLDAVERYWATDAYQLPLTEGLRAIGLVFNS